MRRKEAEWSIYIHILCLCVIIASVCVVIRSEIAPRVINLYKLEFCGASAFHVDEKGNLEEKFCVFFIVAEPPCVAAKQQRYVYERIFFTHTHTCLLDPPTHSYANLEDSLVALHLELHIT